MPLGSFGCPHFTLTNIFCPTQAAVSPVIAEVARAIYYNGRSDGVSGLEAVAHVIQNRMAHPSYPQDAASVVRLNTEDFAVPQNASMAQTNAMDRQLIEHARRLATMLVNAPHRLTSEDPTSGALHLSTREVSSSTQSRGVPGTAAGTAGSTRSGDALACLREQRGTSAANFGMLRRHVAMPGPHPEGMSNVLDLRSHGGLAAREGESTGGSSASAASSTHGAGTGPGSVPPGSQAAAGRNPSTAFSDTWDMPRSRHQGLPLRPPLPGGRSSRIALPGAMGERLSFGREVDGDGYHDMMLPCGLFQDEVIDIMYRDLTPEDFERLCKLDERLPKRNTLQRNTVERLTKLPARNCSSTECRVCLGEFDPASSVVQLPCNHAFHPACISKWLTQCKDTCPLCSAPIEPVSKEGGVSEERLSADRCAGSSSSTSANPPGSASAAPQASALRHGHNI
mmetsp:Transcript_9540/g.21867  ORF Transcript_9540/g.21867 Transcript_9540/m.21867 type:complete len:453 (+) Transcript_9540:207-1565(+)